MRKIAALGTALLIGGGLVAGASPAQAQPTTMDCGTLLEPVCPVVNRQLAHAYEEVGYTLGTVYAVYDNLDRTVRCVVFGQCT